MALACRDFTPRCLSGVHARHLQWEAFSAVTERVNQWLAVAGVRVVSVETLLLPSSRHDLPNPTAGGQPQKWDEDHSWVQVVRIWYEVPPVGAPVPASVSLPPPVIPPAPSPASEVSPESPPSQG